ncbi:MAG: M4 family metallopeptidase [Actinomycetota bacterium]|nr:M4 family metallopeptidase [Actinomycetota bacterium]
MRHGTDAQRVAAARTLEVSGAIRAERTLIAHYGLLSQVQPPSTGERRSVYDAHHASGNNQLPGELVRQEGQPAAADPAVNEAFDGAGATYSLFKDVYARDSIDGGGMEIVSSVHVGVELDNAMWDGREMLYGDGGEFLQHLTGAVDVCGHELTHGVTQTTAGLIYSSQSGALNESMSDVFGSLVKQYANQQTADQADWLIGAGVLKPGIKGSALRSMNQPGTAYEGDDQPSTMDGYDELGGRDNGGVHRNSGIPNRAFALAAVAIGGQAWAKAGWIWYVTLTERLQQDSDFAVAARATIEVAKEKFDDATGQAVEAAWKQVKVL